MHLHLVKTSLGKWPRERSRAENSAEHARKYRTVVSFYQIRLINTVQVVTEFSALICVCANLVTAAADTVQARATVYFPKKLKALQREAKVKLKIHNISTVA